ncbi:MAG: hypothetical protein JNL74_12545, partial [Fibrobacteres bacterium]|nr:hypothetical protein [Fibrobacterota bacterium]
MIQIKTILLFVMALTVSLQALTAFPMKLTVQRGDTLSFTPFVKGWDSTVTSVDVRLSTPANGTVRFIPEWFDSNSYYKSAMAAARTAPKGFPGLFYVPKSGFTGLDSFTYRIVTSADSTETVQCLVRVTPPEASGMTVLLVVNNSVYPSIQPEVERLKTDLINEGYSSRIIPFTVPAVWSQTDAKAIWDTLSREYDNRTRMLAGAILIGQMPFYKSSKDNFPKESTLVKMSAYWSMTKWEGDLEADSTIIGYRVNRGTYGGTHYTPGFLNIWVSNMNGANVPQLGTETELLKRVLQTNHEYRTGICRYPHTAWVYDQYPINNNGGVGMDARRFLKIWPSYSVHAAGDSINHPFKYEYKSGGELWQINQHSSATQYYTIYKYYSGIKVWRYTTGTEFYNTIFPFRFLL